MNDSSSIIGHQLQLDSLHRDLSIGTLAHAYLFVGPQNIGKSTVASLFGEQILGKSNSHDLIRISDLGESLKISEIRELIEKVNMTSFSGKRFVLIENIQRISIEGSNALLKTLEEPNPGQVFVLTTENINDVPDTIISRCRVLKFTIVAKELIENNFPNLSDDLIQIVNGRVGLAFKFENDEEFRSHFENLLSKARAIEHEGSIISRFTIAEELAKDSKKALDFLDILLRLYREKLLKEDYKYPITKKIAKILEGRDLVQKNVNIRLLFENLFLCI